MTVRDALGRGTTILNSAGIGTPGADAGVMLCHVMGCDRAYLYAHGLDKLDNEIYEKYALLLTRRCSGMPVQYIVGRQEFMSLDFHVTPDVLIPRQDTEILVEAVLEYGKKSYTDLKILEIGTGSGCIAISLAFFMKRSFVVATDISSRALEIARWNAMYNSVNKRIEFVHSNLFNTVNMTGFDFIISNPPYIRTDEINTLQREVKDFEPLQALDGGMDGLFFYRNMIKAVPGYLKRRGVLVLEVGIDQAGDVSKLMAQYFTEISVIKDLSGIERVVTGIL